MAKGGARVGAGRKPKKPKGSNVLSMPGVHPPPASDDEAAAVARAALLEPSPLLPEDEQAIYRRLAPLAVSTGMLTLETVPGLEHLCEVCVTYAELRATIKAEGAQVTIYEKDDQGNTFPLKQERHVLWPQLQAFAIRREQGLRSFGLLANGKPVPAAEGASAGDPWAERSRRQA
jgi:hypothetical protein